MTKKDEDKVWPTADDPPAGPPDIIKLEPAVERSYVPSDKDPDQGIR